jgi:hypothetical protein
MLVALVLVGDARATECAPIAGGLPELEHIDASVRLRFIRDRLRVEAHKTRIWAWTWAGIYSTITVVDLGLLHDHSRHALIDNGVGAGASAVGILSIALVPPAVIGDQYWLERRLRNATPGTDACALLADAERLLMRSAKSAAFGKSPLIHAGNFAFNLGVSFLLGFGFGHWEQAALQGLVGIAVGEVMIISQPAELVRDLRRYRAANLGLPPNWHPVSWSIAPMIGQHHTGLMAGITF